MFEIIIKQKKTVTKLQRPQWVKLSTKEVSRDRHFFSEDSNEPKTRIEDVMGYAPVMPGEEVEEVELLKQQVESLDLPAVIKAINKL